MCSLNIFHPIFKLKPLRKYTILLSMFAFYYFILATSSKTNNIEEVCGIEMLKCKLWRVLAYVYTVMCP